MKNQLLKYAANNSRVNRTPGQWKIIHEKNTRTYFLGSEQEQTIAMLHYSEEWGHLVKHDECKANAEHIVKCVSSYDDLVSQIAELCLVVKGVIEDYENYSTDESADKEFTFYNVQRARDALNNCGIGSFERT